MSGGGFHVHGPHDHELEHAAQGGHGEHDEKGKGMIAQIAVITAVIATVGALFAYMGGATQACTKTMRPSRKPKPPINGISFRPKVPNSHLLKSRATCRLTP